MPVYRDFPRWIAAFALAGAAAQAQVEAPACLDYAQKKAAGNMGNSTLLDFSYAGYHFSEKPIPDVASWLVGKESSCAS